MKKELKKVVALSSSYPQDSTANHFLKTLYSGLCENFNIKLLALRRSGSARIDQLSKHFTVKRLRITPFGDLGLLAEDGIFPAVKRKPYLIVVVPFLLISQFWGLLLESNIDIIHANWLFPSGFVAAVYKQLFRRRVKLVCTVHGSDFYALKGVFWGAVRKYIIKRCDLVVCVSDVLRGDIDKLDIISSDKLLIGPMGIDTVLFTPQTASRKKEIIFVGRLIKGKGVMELIQAFDLFREKNRDYTLHIVGKGELGSQINEIDGIKMHGFLPQEEIVRLFNRAKLFVLPSRSEGLGLTPLEAMSSGCPALLSNIKVFQGYIKDGENGFLFEMFDENGMELSENEIVQNLAAKLEAISHMEDKQVAKIALEGVKLVRESYAWGKVVQNYEKILSLD